RSPVRKCRRQAVGRTVATLSLGDQRPALARFARRFARGRADGLPAVSVCGRRRATQILSAVVEFATPLLLLALRAARGRTDAPATQNSQRGGNTAPTNRQHRRAPLPRSHDSW